MIQQKFHTETVTKPQNKKRN